MLLAARWLFCVYFYPLTFRCSVFFSIEIVHGCRWKIETHTHIVDFFQWLVVMPHFFSIFSRSDGFFPFTTLLLFDVWYAVQCLYCCVKIERVACVCTITYVCERLFRSFVLHIYFYLFAFHIDIYSNFFFLSLTVRCLSPTIVHPQESEKWKCTKITNEICACVFVRNKCFSHYVWWSVHKYYSYSIHTFIDGSRDAINANSMCACVWLTHFYRRSLFYSIIEFEQTHYYSYSCISIIEIENWIFFIWIESILKCNADQMESHFRRRLLH